MEVEVEVTSTWLEATAALSSVLDTTESLNVSNVVPGDNIIDLITKFQLAPILMSWYIDQIRNYFVAVVAPRFWKHFSDFEKVISSGNESENHKWVNTKLSIAVSEIFNSVVMFERIQDDLLAALQKSHVKLQRGDQNTNSSQNVIHFQPREMLRVALFTEESNRYTFHNILFRFFLRHFVNFNKRQKQHLDPESDEEEENEQEEEEGKESDGEDVDMSSPSPSPSSSQFADLCAKLHHCDLLVISEEIFTEILFDQIEKYISLRCKGKYSKSYMPSIQHWANVVVFEWLKLVICLDNNSSQKEKNFHVFQQWKTRLEFNIFETYANLRIQEIFSLILEFPDSTPALLDLQTCLRKTNQHQDLVANLKKSNAQRLLQPGANTSDIIQQYIYTIKAMKLIDPSGVILDEVGDPIRNYLQQREDTIRCIVTSFTTDDEAQHSELFEEFRRGKNRIDKNEDNEDDDEEEEVGDSAGDADMDKSTEVKQWQPDPWEASPTKSKHRKQDTISMLVNIYGSSELFVNEYRNMLADRLIAITDYDVDKEVRNLELLKLRFEESSLHNCEIMLKDMADSKRTNALIKKACEKEGEALAVDVIIVSHLFWPTIKEEALTLPEPIQQEFEKYGKQYEHIKGTRHLTKKPHLGTVDLVLQFGDTSLPFSVSPAHAAIIYLFQDDQTTLPLDTIATKTGMPKDVVRKKLVYWVNNQILQETSKDIFRLLDRDESSGSKPPAPVLMVEEEEAPKPAEKIPEGLGIAVENSIMAMLTMRGKCSLESIHTTLGFFIPNFSATPSDLKLFLQKLIREDKVDLDGSEYSKK